jgi:hypothetical protein
MKLILFFLFIAFTFLSPAQTIINDKNAEVRKISDFTGIQVSGGIDVYLSQSNEYALAVSASDEKYNADIKTEVRNGILLISYDGNSFRLNSNRKLRAYISFKTLESLEGSGASDFIINGTLKANSIKIELSGASEIKGTLHLDNLLLNLEGASIVKANGTVKNIKINANGASDIKNYDLVVDHCVAELSGASDVKITINKSLSAKASGASLLYYKGNPEKTEISSSGASSISQRN